MKDEKNLINSKLFRKLNSNTEFYTIEDLLKDIWANILSDRKKILELLDIAIGEFDKLKEEILKFNDIDALPNIAIFGDVPNKYLDNLNNNISLQIAFLNAIQKIQATSLSHNSTDKPSQKETNEENEDFNSVINKYLIDKNESGKSEIV